MRKFLLPLLLFLVSGGFVSANAQPSGSQVREAEWKNYQLPKTNFIRQTDSEKQFVFRVPAGWKQLGALSFSGPHDARLEVIVEKVPEGFSFEEYFGAALQTIKDLSSGSASIITRKTQLQGHDARELVIDTPDPEGILIRSIVWLTIRGTQAIAFNIKMPVANAAEIEPYFKAVMQSVIFPRPNTALETLKNSTIKSATAGPIHELQNIVASLSEATSERDAAITRLAVLYSPPTDAALDLLVDDRPLVRLAAIQAAVRSNNPALTSFLWEVLDDREPLVAEAAARGLATTPDLAAKVFNESGGTFDDTQRLARVWPFLTKEKRSEALGQVFKENPRPKVRVRPGHPPPIAIAAGRLGEDPNMKMGALMLLMSVPREEFELPFARLLASTYDPLISLTLQTAFIRKEPVPAASLLKLVSATDKNVSKLAAMNLAFSANATDIPQIETLISKTAAQKELNDELKLAVKKINFRQQFDTAKSGSERQELVNKALSDSSIAEFAWQFHCEVTVAGCASNAPTVKRDLAIKPFGENLFPKKVQHYTAIPNPRQTVQNFYQTLHGLQMDSPRAQSNLVLMMGHIRRLIGYELSAPVDAETLIDYTGIDPDSPIALAAWTAEQADDRITGAHRQAIVLRVKDRTRFERLIEKFQRGNGRVTDLTNNLSIGARAVAALPAVLPVIAQAALAEPSTPGSRSVLTYSSVGEKQWNGLRIKTFEHAWINSEFQVEHAWTHLVYFGDTAIITPDLETLRNLLVNASAGSEFLADNAEFRQALERQGDAVYFADLNAVFADAFDGSQKVDWKISERGALKFASSSWENSHQLVFAESEWSKTLLPFNPKELTAPRDLLPASTVAYFLTKLDVSAAWSILLKEVMAKASPGAMPDVGPPNLSEMLAELGPECGVALLELPNFHDFSGGSWAAFCKLKGNKLADALTTGKLSGATGTDMYSVELKVRDEPVFLSVRNGFIVVSNQAKPFAAPDNKSSLSTTRDYSRSAEKVPGNIVAFAGYNLEAAVAAAGGNNKAGETQSFFANVIFSFANAFHSQNFFATATAGTVTAHSSVAMDREGRYAIADFSDLPRERSITYAVIEAGGIPITDHNRVSRLVLKVRAKAPGPIDNIKDDIKTSEQSVEQKSPTELLVTVAARRPDAEKAIQLPIKNPELAEYLKATAEFAADKQQVIDQARQIAGDDRDAWSVARKLADWTHKNLEWKFVVSADAVQTLATREADCSEFSELFVGMARSLGLPARMVSGLAYNGSSFGGHAWVEVWIGKWVELDPTWGTHFVDATHIRNSADTLLTSAGLKLIELEVIETSHSTAEFQKTPRALAEHLVKAIPAGDKSELEAAFDIVTLTDLYMGAGAWAKLNEREREQMWSTYRKLVVEIIIGYSEDESGMQPDMRLLHVEEKGDSAEAFCLWNPGELFMKLRFVRRNEVWQLVEVVQADTGFAIAAEHMQPAMEAIERVRAGQKPSESGLSDFVRVLLLMDKDPAKAVVLADELLKAKPKDARLRFLKAMSLLEGEKASEGDKILRELSGENYAPAVARLADYLSGSEEGDGAKVSLEMYERYTKLEPYDSRGFRDLALAYELANRKFEAEAPYRKAVELDPVTQNYVNLMQLLVTQGRVNEAKEVLAAGEKVDANLFGVVMRDLLILEAYPAAETFAAVESSRMKTSALGNLSLARIFANQNRYAEAERHFNAAALLDNKSPDPHIGLAMLYRKQSRWLAALKAADKAISIDAKDSEGHYQRACALARLRRIKEAMDSLTKAVEIQPDQVEYMVEEEDLKPLSKLPAFKKLLPEPVNPQPAQPQQQPQFWFHLS